MSASRFHRAEDFASGARKHRIRQAPEGLGALRRFNPLSCGTPTPGPCQSDRILILAVSFPGVPGSARDWMIQRIHERCLARWLAPLILPCYPRMELKMAALFSLSLSLSLSLPLFLSTGSTHFLTFFPLLRLFQTQMGTPRFRSVELVLRLPVSDPFRWELPRLLRSASNSKPKHGDVGSG